MGFPTALSSGQKTTLRQSNYWSRVFAVFNPGEIVFQCEANEDLTAAPFKAFQWTNTLDGAYTDVWAGMVVYISSTSDYLKNYKYRGRVRLTPSATEFRIDLNATTLNTGDIVTVIRDTDLFARVRETDLVDGSVSYTGLPPMTTGLPSVVVLYDSDNDDEVTWTPAQTGIAVGNGTSISSYAWAISGSGTSSVSSASAQNPDFTFQAGYHYLVRLTTTDSAGVANFILVQVYAVTRTFAAPVILPAVTGSVSQDIDSGYTGSITAYSGVSNLPYRTHAAVFAVEHFGDDSSTPIVSNILMHGRLRSESITTEGSDEGGRDLLVTYPIEGITSYLQRLKVPNDIVRHAASPDAWGEITNPTPYRMAVYFLSSYSTLLNQVSFSAGDSLFDAWRWGGEPVSIDGGYALDTLTTILAAIDAAPNTAPDGEIRCEITASYKSDRSGLVTIMDFTLSDVLSVTLDIDTSRITGQVTGYGGSWNTTNNTFVLYTAFAPTVPYSDAPETRELTRVLLQYDSTAGEAADELAERTGADYAFNNPKKLLSLRLLDSHRWLVATNYQRYTLTMSATENVRGIALTTATKFQCQSVDLTINTDGTVDVDAQLVEETTFVDAQSVASLLPDNLSGMNPVMPVLSNDPAFPDDPLWMFPTDTPTTAEFPPIDPFSDYLANSPFTPDQAADSARKQGTAKCRAFQVLARNSGTTNSPFLTVNTDPYTLKITGTGSIGADAWIYPINFLSTPGTDVFDTVTAGTWTGGTGYTSTDITVPGPVDIRSVFLWMTAPPAGTYTGITFTYDLTKGTFGSIQPCVLIFINGTPVETINSNVAADGASLSLTWAGSQVDPTSIYIQVLSSYGDWSGSCKIRSATLSGTGTNPFTGSGGVDAHGDWFYRFYPDEEGSAALFEATEGGLIDGAKPSVIPPYNPNHEYLIPWVGTGNAIQAAYALADYTDVQNFAFTIQACRV